MSDSRNTPASTSGSAASPVGTSLTTTETAQPLQRVLARIQHEWLPLAVWSIGRTGRAGLVGIALLLASGVFFASTHSKLAGEVDDLREQLETARARPATSPASRAAEQPARLVGELPTRVEVPALLGTLVSEAEKAHLSIDTGKYEVLTTKASGVTRYHVSFPITGAYVQIREFIDGLLVAMPAAAISELSIERKQVGDGAVEAQLQLTLYTRGAP